MTMFHLKPSEVRREVIQDMEAGLVPFIQSSPGLGKSAIVKQIAKDFDLELIDLRLSQCAPEDLMGLPMRRGDGDQARAFFAPFETFPIAGQDLPKGKNGWLLFLDEFNSATKMVQAAAYKLALDKMVGQAHLHENCFVVCAGNLASDRAIVTQQSTAMQSRLTHYEMVADHEEFMKHAVKAGFDHRVLGFLEFQPGKLHSFQPDHQDRTFPCPRTWEFVSRKIKGREESEFTVAGLAACISDGVAVELHTFIREYSKLPKYQKILDEAATLAVPNTASTCYAIITMMLDRYTRDTFDKAVVYAKRLSPELQVIYFRGIIARDPSMRRERNYATNIAHLTKFLLDTSDEDAAAA